MYIIQQSNESTQESNDKGKESIQKYNENPTTDNFEQNGFNGHQLPNINIHGSKHSEQVDDINDFRSKQRSLVIN